MSFGAFWLATWPARIGALGQPVAAVWLRGIGGFVLRFQGLVVSPAARSGGFAATAACDLQP